MEQDNVGIHDIRKQVSSLSILLLLSNLLIFTRFYIWKQKEVLEETMQMLPDCEKRYKAAYAELINMIKNAVGESEEVTQAQTILSECVV